MSQEKYTPLRLTREEMWTLTNEMLKNKWVAVTGQMAEREPAIKYFLDSFTSKYEISDPSNMVLLVSREKNELGRLSPKEYRWVHLDDYKKAVDDVQRMRKELSVNM
jgi:hypothetical protein